MNPAASENNLIQINPQYTANDNLNVFLKERFKANIDTFQKHLPGIATFFNSYKPNKKLSFFSLDNGIPNLLISDSDTILYKSENPISFCRDRLLYLMENVPFNQSCFLYERDKYGQIFDKYTNEGASILAKQKKEISQLKELDMVPLVVVSGIGLGYILGELYERINVPNLVIIEPDPDIFFASLHTFDWKNLLDYIFSEHLSIDIVIDNDPQLCFDTFNSIMNDKGAFLSTSPFLLVHYESKFNTDFSKILNTQTPRITSFLGFFDDYAFGISHAAYAFSRKNNHFVKKGVSIEQYKDIPVFVIGSGPSLDNDISFIQQYQNRAIIIACGTAADSLFHTGIKPDFFANTERIPETCDVLDSIPDPHFFDDVTLICSEVCHPQVQKRFLKAVVFGKKNEPFFPYIQNMFPERLDKIQDISNMNPLAGNMGVSSAVTLGFRKIYLFGMDNGIKVENTQIHSNFASLYQKRGAPEEAGFKYECEGNFGHKCKTNLKYLQAIYNVESVINSIAIEDKLYVYNCSDGALIQNTVSIQSQQLKDEFSQLPVIRKKEICDYIYDVKCQHIHIENKEIESLLKKNSFTDLVDSVIKKLSHIKTFNNRNDWIKSLSEISYDLNHYKNSVERFHKRMIETSLQSMFILIVNAMYLCKDFEKCKSISIHFVNLSTDFLEESKDIFNYLPDYVMGEHRKYYSNNKVGRDMPSISAPPMPHVRKLIRAEYKDPITAFTKKT